MVKPSVPALLLLLALTATLPACRERRPFGSWELRHRGDPMGATTDTTWAFSPAIDGRGLGWPAEQEVGVFLRPAGPQVVLGLQLTGRLWGVGPAHLDYRIGSGPFRLLAEMAAGGGTPVLLPSDVRRRLVEELLAAGEGTAEFRLTAEDGTCRSFTVRIDGIREVHRRLTGPSQTGEPR